MWMIEPVPDDSVQGVLREQYDADLAEEGYISNVSRAWSHRPEILPHWQALLKAVRSKMRLRPYELVVVAAARAIGCKL